MLFNARTRQLFYTQQQTALGEPVSTTLGWHIGNLGGMRFFYKEGGGGGFHSMMRLYPGCGIGTVVMSNATGFDVRTFTEPDPAERSAFNRLFYRDRRPTWLGH